MVQRRLWWSSITAIGLMLSCSLYATQDQQKQAAFHPKIMSFKVAMAGDEGAGDDTRAVLKLIKDEGADLYVVPGDFDYKKKPEVWDENFTMMLGESFPVVAAIGNHDVPKLDEYVGVEKKRLAKTGSVQCTGASMVDEVCTYQDLTMVILGVGSVGEDKDHAAFLEQSLQAAKTPWKMCVWHKNNSDMQVGTKTNAVGWEFYEICRKYGAMVITGHEHSYSRTYLLNDYPQKTVVSQDSHMVLQPGTSFAVVTGLGGKSIRRQWRRGAWWSTVYTKTQKANFGALFCEFNKDGQERQAGCYFKNIDGKIVDEFTLESQLP